MRALSLKQPWLHAITDLGKRVENRTWPPVAGSYGERIALHASKSYDKEGSRAIGEITGEPLNGVFVRGAILATAVIVGWIAYSDDGRPIARRDASPQAQAQRQRPQPPANGSPAPPMPTDAMKKKFHALGVELYGDAWDDKRLELTRHISGKREDGPVVDSSNDLYRAEMQSLIDGMEARKAEAEPA